MFHMRLAVGALVACCGLCAGSAMAQASFPPPIKMGLWEVTTNSGASSISIPPEVMAKMKESGRPMPEMGQPKTTVRQQCLTKEQWLKAVSPTEQKDCVRKRELINSQTLAYDVECTAQNGSKMLGHVDMLFDNDESMHGAIHMKTEHEDAHQTKMNMNVTIKARYLAASCGDLKPGESKLVER